MLQRTIPSAQEEEPPPEEPPPRESASEEYLTLELRVFKTMYKAVMDALNPNARHVVNGGRKGQALTVAREAGVTGPTFRRIEAILSVPVVEMTEQDAVITQLAEAMVVPAMKKVLMEAENLATKRELLEQMERELAPHPNAVVAIHIGLRRILCKMDTRFIALLREQLLADLAKQSTTSVAITSGTD
jgi:hypothetical protein